MSFAPLSNGAAGFLSATTDIDFSPAGFADERWLCVTARDERGKLQGVCVFEFKTWFDAHMTCAIVDRRCMSRRLLRAMFTAVFSRAVRVTALVAPTNEPAMRQMRRLGFQYEGFLRLGVEGRRDAAMFGMLRSECPFLAQASPLARFRRADGGIDHGNFAVSA